MDVEILALLRVQRELLQEPRGFSRFQSYLKTMVNEDGELGLPLSAFNPMSKGHVGAVLDILLAMEAEKIAAAALQESIERLRRVETLHEIPAYCFGLVVADDAQGGWTNRYLFEAKDRFENRYGVRKGFIAALLWSSEEPTAERIRLETAGAIFRTAWLWTHGLPATLGQMLRQEGMVARFAGMTPEPLVNEASAALLRKNLESSHYPTLIACLYGDEVAESLGYDRIGMFDRDGMRYAISDEFLGSDDPVDALSVR